MEQLKVVAGRHRVLHVGGSIADARTIREALTGSNGEGFDVEWVGTLSAGLERLTTNRISAVLLDLLLPDCSVIDGVVTLLQAAPSTPILVVGADEDDGVAQGVIQAGARDYLLTKRLDSYWLPRALSHVIERTRSEEALLAVQTPHLASHDPLTDLPNRVWLSDRLTRALAMAESHQRRLAVLFLDIDRFKHVNDSLGHMFGDELLRIVGRVLTTCVRSSDTVSRQGGDEFVVVLSELEHAQEAAVGAQQIIAALVRPITLADHELHITVSIGISVYPDDGEDADTLLKRADLALCHAKDQGRDCYQFFEPELNVRAVERQSIEAALHCAIDKREFELLYQPKMNLRTGAVVGAEALIRWRHPDRGLIVPADFVRIAEDCGLIKPIGRWVVHEACRQAREWQDAGLCAIPVSVNISAAEFRSRDFLANVADILKATRLDPRYLEIELAENVLMAHVESTTSVLHALKKLGVSLAIDDFGTCWSSLSELRHFPIDTLKVDKSFVHEITVGSHSAPIVSAVISMGKSLNHRVIAKGVETLDQVAFLQAEDCDEGQGYYFSRPLVAQQLARALKTGTTGVMSRSEPLEWARSQR